MNDEMPRVELNTPDLAAEKLAAFKDLFPGVIADGVLDAARLGELLDTEVTAQPDGRERFGLMWAGKQEAVRSLLAPSRGALLPEFDKSTNFDEAQHTFIQGDNLEVLKLLQKAYNDRVKLIYIDPPYNTGSDFVYGDDFADTLRAYLRYTGQVDDDGNRRSTDTDVSGRRHSRWLSMMYPRLVLGRNLLTQDGAIFVSIDDNEVANLRLLLDEVFGPENFISSVVWQKRYSRENRGSIGDAHEYLLVYARNKPLFEEVCGRVQPTEKQVAVYKNPNNDPRGRWRPVPLTAQAGHATPSQFYTVVTPSGAKHDPPDGRCWSVTEAEMQRLREEGRVYFGKNGDSQPNLIRYLDEVDGFVPWTWWPSDEVGHTDEAAKEVKAVFGTQTVFDTAKPVRLLRRVLEIGAPSGGIVLDFFAGSGTIANAVLAQNKADGGRRQFIAIQLPEVSSGSRFEKISDVTRARIGAALEEFAPTDGLRSFRLGASCFRDETTADPEELFDMRESTLDDGDHVMEELAGEILLKEGVPLDAKWTRDRADSATVITANGVAVVLSLEVTDEIAAAALALAPRVVVFLEDGFAGRDAVKANAFTNAKNLGITAKSV